MSPMRSILVGFTRAFDFSGRSSRGEFWPFFIFVFALTVGAQMVDGVNTGSLTVALVGSGPVALAVDLVVVVPLVSAMVRRLHDTDQSGWMVALWLTCLGAIPVLHFLAAEGDTTANRWGAPPADR